MEGEAVNRNVLTQALQARKALEGARAATSRLISTLEAEFNIPLNAPSSAIEYRAMHRPGTPTRRPRITSIRSRPD